MPLLRKKLLERSSTLPDYLRDDEEVFHCEITNEIFKDYEEYCERIILVNSMVWSCAMTGRSNLTYAEALKSEKDALNTLKDFPVELRIPVIYTASLTKCSVIGEMLEEVYLYIRDRFFIGEMVEACIEKDEWQECQVLMVIEPSKQDIAANKEPGSHGTHGSLPASLYRYEVEPLEGDGEAEPVTLQPDKIRRKYGAYSRSKNKLYLKQLIEPSQGIYRIKEDVLKKYNIHKVKFDQLFVGSPPGFTESNKKNNKLASSDSGPKVTGTKSTGSKGSVTSPPVKKQRQETMAKYLTKSDKFQGTKQSDAMVVKKDKDNMKKLDMKSVNIKKTKNTKNTLVDEMKRMGEEMRQKAASNKLRKAEERIKEREKKKEDNLKFTLFTREWKRIKEDLELKDQSIMPVPTPVDTFISNRQFGEFLEVLEFLKTFSEELEVRNVFPGGITWELLERALCLKEINGPLPDILQILLSSMYRMQQGEIAEVTEREGAISGPDKIESATLSTNVELATVASLWPQQHLGKPLSETQLDSLTLTEILRLHLLASGARTTDARAKWMFQHRGGYDSRDDPGLHLRTTQPHIIKALSMFNICELPMSDVLKIFSCLINQILMYSQIRDVIEDRLEKAAKAKYQLKMLVAKERRRLLEYETVVAKLKAESALKVVVDNLTEDPELQQTLEKMEKKHRKLSMDYATECTDLKQRQFAYQMYLGSDRAHRRYWLFESVPGLFVEHNEKWPGNCLSNVVRQYPELVNNGADNSDFLRKLYNEQKASCDKENISLMKSPKKNQEKGNLPESPLKGASLQSIMDLNMCTANYSTCKVHGNANKVRWSFYNTSEQINELIKSLNTRGLRENVLRANLEQEKVLIVNHIIQCPVANLTKIQTDVVTDVKKIHKKYNDNNVNLSHPPGTDKSIILGNTLREYILELEDKLSSGYLGNLKVPDRNKWRSAILNDGYDMQCDEIIYGRSAQYVEKNPKRVAKENKNNNLNGAMKEEKDCTPEIKTLGEEISEGYEYKYPTIIYKDPGNYLGDTMDLDSEESSGDEDFVVYQQTEQKEQIHNLACALLQVAQSVDTKFLRKPLGVAVDKRNRKESKPMSDGSVLKCDKKTHKVYEHWCLSLMAATSYSQVFLHYHTLEDSIIWSQSAAYANCRTCRRRKDPEMILLCDGCNKGNHMYCLKPPLTEVPEGDWYCSTCRPIQTPRPVRNKKRRLFSQAEEPEEVEEEQESDNESEEEEEEEDEEEEEEEEEDSKSAGRQSKLTNGNVNEEEENSEDEDNSEEEDRTLDSDDEEEEDAKSNSSSESTSSTSAELFTVCALCGSGGELISCDECSNSYHIECTEPPLKRAPRGRWSCMDCKPSVPARRTREALASSLNAQDLHHEPRKCALQSRSRILSFTRTLRRGSVDDETDTSDEPPTRRSRRTLDCDEDLPLHNAALQELLSDVIKHKDSWPFTRPVLQSEVPDYFDIIKQPMDFGTIRSKLNLGDYSSDKEILLDVKLVFNNCDAYNNNNSPVFKAGIRLEKFVEKRCKELCLNIPDDSETNETGTRKAD